MDKLKQLLHALNGKGYKSYKQIKGCYRFPGHTLEFDHIQGDPFAAPTRITVRVTHEQSHFSTQCWSNASRCLGFEDFVARTVATACQRYVRGRRGSGNSGRIGITTNQQYILKRNALTVHTDHVAARMVVGLPADGRSVAAREAEIMLFDELPQVIRHSLYHDALDVTAMGRHIECCEDQDALRHWLHEENLVAFVADGALLPRRSGVDDQPLSDAPIVFTAPPTLRRTVTLPHAGTVSGMAISSGVTLVVGGGFHGKSTLLRALERGVYNHIPGDGREQVVTVGNAVKIRAEDGRVIHDVDISAFIDHLPFDRDTRHFHTENASGSTSQAANIMEALETGCKALLIDEDTSATNFMIRDERMQQLVARDKEPITPLLHRVRELHRNHDISSVIVMGGSGDYLDVADHVIMMDTYQACDVSEQARALTRADARPPTGLTPWPTLRQRRLPRVLLNAERRNGKTKIDAGDHTTLLYGEHEIDLSRVEQLVDPGQIRTIGQIIRFYVTHYHENTPDSVSGIQRVLTQIATQGLDILMDTKTGTLAVPRLQEIMAAINRIRPD